MELRTQQIQLKPNNKQATMFAKHAGYARVAYNFAVSAYRVGQERGDVPHYTVIKKEFNTVKYDGTVYPNPRPLMRYMRKLIHVSRALSRKVKYSKNWYKAKKKLAAVHCRGELHRDTKRLWSLC